MLLFCPKCGNVLTITAVSVPGKDHKYNRLECKTCPFEHLLAKNKFFDRTKFQRPVREDVFGGPGAWDNAQKTNVQCPNEECDGQEAAFYSVQIRSADEPMTNFYKCMTCDQRWRE